MTKEELEETVKELKSIAKSLETSGILIGWEIAPWNDTYWEEKGRFEAVGIIVGWLLSVLLAGLLIGLGGPFWFNVFRKLGALAGMVRGMQTPAQQAREQGKPTGAMEPGEFTKVFETAAKANALAHGG